MNLYKTDQQPDPVAPVCACGRVMNFCNCEPTDERVGDDEIWQDVYHCPTCGEYKRDTERLLWMADDGEFYALLDLDKPAPGQAALL